MKEPEREAEQERSSASAVSEDGVGDVEMAGETTAASAIKGPDDTSPVGAETLVRVAGADETARGAETSGAPPPRAALTDE